MTSIRYSLAFAAAIIVLETVLIVSPARTAYAEDDADLRFQSAPDREFNRRAELLKRELASPNRPDWAGEYYVGLGVGDNNYLTVAPQTGFTFLWRDCLVCERNYGSVNVTADGMLKLRRSLPGDAQRYGLAEEFVPVSWGTRHYLIERARMIEFCNAINRRLEPRDWTFGQFYLRKGDELKPARGDPALPRQYANYILHRPIRARILTMISTTSKPVASAPSVEWESLLRLDKGRSDGLLKGMELSCTSNQCWFPFDVTIASVGEHEAIARHSGTGPRSDLKPSFPAGTLLTTGYMAGDIPVASSSRAAD